MAGAGPEHRHAQRILAAENPAQPVAERLVEAGRPGPGLLGDGRPEVRGAGAQLLHGRAHLGLVGAAAVQPAGHVAGDRVDAAGRDGHLPDRGDAPTQLRGLAGAENEVGIAEHRVAPVLQPGGARVVGLPREVEAPPAVRPDVAGHCDGYAQVDQAPPLLHVQLDERAHPAQRLLVPAHRLGVSAGGDESVRHTDAVGIGEPQRPFRCHRPGDHPRPRAGDPEPGPLLIHEVDHRQRARRRDPRGPQRVDGGEGGDDTEGSVIRPAVRDRVEVGADRDAAVPGRDGVVHAARPVPPPGPLVAHPVLDQVQPAAGALGGEPLAEGVVLAGPGKTPVAAGRYAADRPQLGPHAVERGGDVGDGHTSTLGRDGARPTPGARPGVPQVRLPEERSSDPPPSAWTFDTSRAACVKSRCTRRAGLGGAAAGSPSRFNRGQNLSATVSSVGGDSSSTEGRT